MTQSDFYDAIIIGGSFAGLSAGLALGRSVRNVLILDTDKPCNRFTPHSHNFLTHDGRAPAEILLDAKEDLIRYKTVRTIKDSAIDGKKINNGFEVYTESGKTYRSRKLIVATGVKDILPSIPGFADCWGKSIIHCPYCHGYEYRTLPTAILGNGSITFEFAKLIFNLTKNLTIITNGPNNFNSEEKSKLDYNNIKFIEDEVDQIEQKDGFLQSIKFSNGSKTAINALYYRPNFEHNSLIPKNLGCEFDEMGYLKIDSFAKTTINGVYACGDNTTMMRSVANAVALGNLAGAIANKDLSGESF